jgi:anti-sigma regulatory factor (Ser/Thr protein kinase)
MTQTDRPATVSDEALTSCQAGEPVRIVLENTMAAVDAGRLATLDYLAPLALDDRVINRIEVILEELIGNLARHGAVDALTLGILARPDDIELVIEDDGPEFNPLELTTPARFTTLEEAELGGLGIPLVRRLSRSVRYQRIDGDDDRGEPSLNRIVVTIAR